MRALSVSPVWAWCILHGGKDIENRFWPYAPKFRGQFLIHAGLNVREDDLGTATRMLQVANPSLTIPSIPNLPRGGLAGVATLVDVQLNRPDEPKSPWEIPGHFGFVLADVKAFPEVMPWKGAQSFFHVPDTVAQELLRGLP
ncbi:MAG TPA: hypothetical protein VHO25_22235 [Polyangiaceae bacterium]|nr:hypothetical protein [Polyangiaceae bacterium]